MDSPDSEGATTILAIERLPRYGELPSFGVYVDQLISFVNDSVGSYYLPEEKLLTASMVNNYVKQGVVPKPEKKKYTRDHIAYLMVVCVLKKVFSIQEVTGLIAAQIKVSSTQEAYDSFINCLEQGMAAVFAERQAVPPQNREANGSAIFVEKAVFAVANKVYVQRHLLHFAAPFGKTIDSSETSNNVSSAKPAEKPKGKPKKQKGGKHPERLP